MTFENQYVISWPRFEPKTNVDQLNYNHNLKTKKRKKTKITQSKKLIQANYKNLFFV